MVCIRCQKRPAIIFVQRMENGQMKNEGYCLHCAREMHIKPVDDLMKQFGMSDEDMDAMEDRMENMMQEMGDMSSMNPFSMMMGMGQPDQSEEDGDLVPGSSATFPLGVNGGAQNGKNEKKAGKNDKKPPRRKFLDTYCENLTRKAREGKLDDIIGRDREIYRTIQILSRRQKNNPCLIGEAGVGKTAIAEGIAERIAKGQVPAGLQDKEIFLLDLTSLVAGTQFRGQFEQRVKGLLSEVKAAGNVILFIDEIHTITSAGESEGAMNAGNILKPALSRGEIQVIGATTFNEYRKYIEKDQALERRFQPVRVEEPSVADTLAVMGGIKHYYEEHHHVQVPADVLNATVTLSERYITDRYLPDKAIDLLDEACACCNLAHPVISEYLTMQKELEALKQEEADMENADVNEPIDYERVAERKTRMAQLERELPAKQAAAGEIQVTMDDVAKVIEMCQLLFIHTNGSLDYYHKLKSLISSTDWKEYLSTLMQETTFYDYWGSGNNKADIYIEEKEYDKLFSFLSAVKYRRLDALVQYASHLNATHSSQILSLFTDDLRVYAEKNLGRSHYEYIARVLRGMRKLNGGKDVVKQLVEEFRVLYKRRPAMMQELGEF